MNEHAAQQQQQQQQQPDSLPPPIPPPIPPGASPPAREDRIDPDSADAKSAAPSEGSGVSGDVEPPREEQSWMQDA